MASHVEAQMKRAERLINAGRKKEALELLRPITESNPEQAKLWWLVACSAAKPETQRKALEKALRIQPHFPEAQRMLEVVKLLPTGTAAKLQTMELLQAETTNGRASNPRLPLLLVIFILLLVLGAGGIFVVQQMAAATPTPLSATASVQNQANANLNAASLALPAARTQANTFSLPVTTASPTAESRIVVNAEVPFSFVLPPTDCWAFIKNESGGLFTCTVADRVIFSGSLNIPYGIEAMNAPQQTRVRLAEREITVYEGNPVQGIAAGDALWLITDVAGKTASLLALTSLHAADDVLDPYKQDLYALLLSVAWE